MKTNHPGALVLLLAGAILAAAPWAVVADQKSDLQARFMERLAPINQLKRDGKVGETFDGLVEAVRNVVLEKDQKKLVDDENADRNLLYRLIADEEATTVGKVAERNALRQYKNGKKGDWFKLKDGQWKQKEKD